ncbi:MAG: FtsB family cell division protein [Candidatus Binatia bacterium]
MRHIFTVRRLGLFATLAVFSLLFLSTILGRHGLLHLWKLHQEQRALEAEAFTLLRGNEELRSRIARLQTDGEFFEKVVRERLGLVREGELVYRFRRSPDAVGQ